MANLMRVRATIAYGAGGPGLGTFYWLPAGGTPSAGELADAVARVRAFYAAFAALLTPSTSVLVQGEVDTINDATGTLTGTYAATPPAAVVGTGSTTELPPFTCIVMRLRSNAVIRGRLLKGRSFVGPLSAVASTATGTPTTGVGTAGAAAVTALLAVTSTAIPTIWHRPSSLGPGSNGGILTGDAWSQFGSLRSRRD